MYSQQDLEKYEYFNNLLKNNKLEYILDPLTGVISRKYILDYVKYLIKTNNPFSMAILDLDNFKEINDNYGHATGDRVLENIGKDLLNYSNQKGLIGRFGGDEFVVILVGHYDYDGLHNFYDGMYHNNTVFRKIFKTGKHEIFITATLGSASFPDNGKTYNELFSMSDKTLYRGKVKGRNCYIIYVHEKHKDLEINKMANDDEATIFFNIHSIFHSNDPFKEKMMDINEYLKKNLRLDFICYIDNENNLYNLNDMSIIAKDINLNNLKFNNELIKSDTKHDIKKISLPLYEATRGIDASSLLITRIRTKKEKLGYIFFGLERSFKIWTNDEIASLMYLSNNIMLDLLNI